MTERQAQEAKQKIGSYRAAAAAFPAVRRVVESFAGKCYSKRFSDALKSEIGESGYIYAEKTSHYIRINFSARDTQGWCQIASVKIADALPDGKWIDAAAIVDDMRERRADMLRRAYEIEETGRNVDAIQARLDAIAREVAAVLEPISYEARDVYGLRFSSAYTR